MFFKDSHILNGTNNSDIFVVICIPTSEVCCQDRNYLAISAGKK